MFTTHERKNDHEQENYLAKLRYLTKRLEPISVWERDEIGNEMISRIKSKGQQGRQDR